MQRALLRVVEETSTDLRPELWLCVTTVDLGLGEHRESRRRAAHGLAALGLIELCCAAPRRASEGAVRRWMLFARLPMGAASQVYAEGLRAEYREHSEAMWAAPIESGSDYERHNRWIVWYLGPEHRDHVYDLDRA